MKRYILNYKTLFAALMLISFGCKDSLDINQDPNNPSIEAATPEVLFPAGTLSTVGAVGGELAILGGIWSQYWTQSNASNQFKTIDAYNLTKIDLNRGYDELFSGALNDYQLAIKKAQASQDWRYNLMATVMKAYTYQVLADLYDQVPYTEAFQGQANLQPKFDAGPAVYTGLLAELDAALAKDYLSKAFNDKQKASDFIFGGDMTKWAQFANTLELKMYLRMVNAKPADAQAGITKLYTAGANFLTESAGMSDFPGIADGSNPLYEYNFRRLNTTTNLRASYTLTQFLVESGDPRNVSYFGTAAPVPMHQGDYTATQAQQPTYANATVPAIAADAPVYLISASESYFMQAEARERYFAGAGAKALYDTGVQAAFDEADAGSAAAFTGPGGRYVYPTAGTFQQKLRAIITQKWLALPGSHALEAFFEQERTGYPAISPVYSTDAKYLNDPAYSTGYVSPTSHAGEWVYSKNGATSGNLFPKRLVFPQSARDRNKNTPAEVPLTTKVWWGL